LLQIKLHISGIILSRIGGNKRGFYSWLLPYQNIPQREFEVEGLLERSAGHEIGDFGNWEMKRLRNLRRLEIKRIGRMEIEEDYEDWGDWEIEEFGRFRRFGEKI